MIPIKEGFDFSAVETPIVLEHVLRNKYLDPRIPFPTYVLLLRHGLLNTLDKKGLTKALFEHVCIDGIMTRQIRKELEDYLPREIGGQLSLERRKLAIENERLEIYQRHPSFIQILAETEK